MKRLIKAILLTAARLRELAGARVEDLDPSGLLTLDGKTGRRTIPLTAAALDLLSESAGARAEAESLLLRDDGQPWTRYDWRERMREAREIAGLPDDAVLYNLRHVAISEMLIGGVDPMSAARVAGTSVAMIQRHYGHLIKESIVAKMVSIAVL